MGFFFSFLIALLPFAEEPGLQLSLTQESDNKELCTEINIASLNKEKTNIGTSSIFLEYNSQALQFKSYESKAFDKADECEKYPFSAYNDHSYYTGYDGVVNITLTLRSESLICSDISNKATSIAEICFDIIDPHKEAAIRINEKFTSFNKVGENVEVFDNVVFPKREGFTAGDM